MGEKILVTGGAGFIGSHLVDCLLARGHRVRVLDSLEPQVHGGRREAGERPEYLNREAEFMLGDVRSPADAGKALEGIDVVFHEAALVGVGQSMYAIQRYTDVNTNGAAVVLQAIIDRKERPRKLIVASSMSIYGEGAYECPRHGRVYPRLRGSEQLARREWEVICPVPGCGRLSCPCPTDEGKHPFPTSVYAVNKRDQEELFLAVGQAYHIPTVALRYFNVYGSRQALSNPYTGVAAIFCGRLLNRKSPVIFEDGFQSRDFTHVKDIVQANLLVMEDPRADGNVFNVGTGRALTLLEMAEALKQHLGAQVPLQITQKFRAGDIRHCFADIRKLGSLGYRPMVRFEDGVAELAEWVGSQTAFDRYESAALELAQKGLAG